MKEKKYIKNNILYMNMSGVYADRTPREDFLDLPGTNGYCDKEAEETIRQRLKPYPHEGIHFLDSGNYHYLSYFWLEKINCDFSLVLMDHHPDMQKPAFGDILSCGGWVANAMEDLCHLKEVYLVDVDRALVEELKVLPVNVIYKTKAEAKNGDFGRFPLYLSIDKDVLSEDVVMTDWDQGDMTKEELLEILDNMAKNPLLGVDICGEIKENGNDKMQEDQREINRCILGSFCDRMTPEVMF